MAILHGILPSALALSAQMAAQLDICLDYLGEAIFNLLLVLALRIVGA